MYIEQGWLRVVTILIVWTFIGGFFQLAGYELLEWTLSGPPAKDLSLDDHLISVSLTLLATISTLLFFKRFVDCEPINEMGVISHDAGKLATLGALTGTVIISIGFLILLGMNEIVPFLTEVTATDMVKVILLCLIVAMNEELLMRGYIQVNLSRSTNRYVALVITSCLFAFLHIFNMGITDIALVNLVLSGVLLGTGFLFIKNIWYSAGLHFAWNFVQGSVFGFHVSGIDNPSLWEVKYYEPNVWNGAVFGFEGSIVCTLCLVTAIIGMYFYFKRYEVRGTKYDSAQELRTS